MLPRDVKDISTKMGNLESQLDRVHQCSRKNFILVHSIPENREQNTHYCK